MNRGEVVATADSTAGYGLDNAWRHALARLRSLEDWLDPGTIRHLRALDVGAGWRCLEVGAGAGSIARWLSGAVGSGGEVLAIDIDTRFLVGLPEANLRVRRHDVTADDLPAASFDLVHCRLVLADIGTEGRARLWPGGSAGASAWQLTFEQLQPDMVAGGVDPVTIADAIRACQDPGFGFMSQVTMAAWGRAGRPWV
jgi:SAM-dependent methyltransferase